MQTNIRQDSGEESRANSVGRKRKHVTDSGDSTMATGKHIKLDNNDSDSEGQDEVDRSSQASSDFNSRESGQVSSSESPDPSRLAKNAWQSDADSPRKEYKHERPSSPGEEDDNAVQSDSSAGDSDSASDDDDDDKDDTSNSASTGQPPKQHKTNGNPNKAPIKFIPKPAPRLNKYDELVCERCGATGHSGDGCSLLWKTYFPGQNNVTQIPREAMVVSCYNCGISSRAVGHARSHWGDDCPELPAFLRDNPSGLWTAKYADKFVLGVEVSEKGQANLAAGERLAGQRAAFYLDRD
ncbi:hypothetical protein MBLNU230_g3905t1 [Neophaeotheca triangularis]